MRHTVSAFLLSLLFVISTAASAMAQPAIAFGYFKNTSLDFNYDYLEVILPNSLANSMRNIFEARTIKPLSVENILKEEEIKAKKSYENHEIPHILEVLDTDLFITGSFKPLPDNMIEIQLQIHSRDSNLVFSFTNVGRMETEIFKLVDRITQILINYLDEENLYFQTTIKPGSKLAIMTNLQADELNELYCSFMKKGYSLCAFQANSLNNPIGDREIRHFNPVFTERNSFDIISTGEDKKYKYGTWSGDNYHEQVRELKRIYRVYDTEYILTKNDILNRLNIRYGNKIDALMIIGFNHDRDEVWIRCIDMNRKDLIWLQSGIKGGSISEISEKIIKRMTTPLKSPFEQFSQKDD